VVLENKNSAARESSPPSRIEDEIHVCQFAIPIFQIVLVMTAPASFIMWFRPKVRMRIVRYGHLLCFSSIATLVLVFFDNVTGHHPLGLLYRNSTPVRASLDNRLGRAVLQEIVDLRYGVGFDPESAYRLSYPANSHQLVRRTFAYFGCSLLVSILVWQPWRKPVPEPSPDS
jgi:hypothetical protein